MPYTFIVFTSVLEIEQLFVVVVVSLRIKISCTSVHNSKLVRIVVLRLNTDCYEINFCLKLLQLALRLEIVFSALQIYCCHFGAR